MNTEGILRELKAERDRLDKAIVALESLNAVPRKPGRPKGTATSFEFGANKPRRGRRKMSPAARRKISQMMKARWAARRKAAKA